MRVHTLKLIDRLLLVSIGCQALIVTVVMYRGGLWSLGLLRLAPPVVLLAILILIRKGLARLHCEGSSVQPHPCSVIFWLCVAVYLANGKTIWSGDTLPARYLPLSIIREGNLDLDEFPFLYEFNGRLSFRLPLDHRFIKLGWDPSQPYYIARSHGHYLSAYPVGAALVALPVYLLTALGPTTADSPFLVDLEKLAASITVAASAVLLYMTMVLLVGSSESFILTVAYAFGTSSLSVSSQALWQHGPAQLAIVGALYCAVRGRYNPKWYWVAGLPLAFAVVVRPPILVAVLVLMGYVLSQCRVR